MRKQRILALVRSGLEPPETMPDAWEDNVPIWKMEFDIIHTLRNMGHEVRTVGVYDDLSPIRDAIVDWKPHVAFMMLEEFHGVASYDFAVVGYLDLMRQKYTGCNARGLMLTHDKALAKKILSYHKIPTPQFAVFPKGRAVRIRSRLQYPLMVKSATEDASLGISQASIVSNDDALRDRVAFVHEHVGSDAIAEEYIDGRELYQGLLGNTRLVTFPVWEMLFTRMPDHLAHIASSSVKWNGAYQKKHGIETRAAEGLTADENRRISQICRRVYKRLHMSGYGRIDLRMKANGDVYVIEANANPNLSYGEDYAESAEAAGVSYEDLLTKIVRLGVTYKARWEL